MLRGAGGRAVCGGEGWQSAEGFLGDCVCGRLGSGGCVCGGGVSESAGGDWESA